MNVKEVETRVAKIATLQGQADGEAHGLEDDLFLDVLKAIASGARNPVELAAAAIKSADLNIKRWTE
ncbi:MULTISPECIES: hypothetical protein [Burkholderia cepacia complex]|nr:MULTISPECIES: hypothetical protein [Burkholderia cepacia complex]